MDMLRHFEQQQIKDVERPYLQPGDVVRVGMKVTEGEKSRQQMFEGVVLGVRGSGPSATFTVRRETSGFGVERIFPLFSPLIVGIEIVKRQKVRRAKLTYLRQAGRRRFKEDVAAMQRHVKEKAEKERLAEEARKREEEAKLKEEEETQKREVPVKSPEGDHGTRSEAGEDSNQEAVISNQDDEAIGEEAGDGN